MTGVPLPRVNARETIRALEKAGFTLRRQRGSHAVLVHSGDLSRRCVVPVHGPKTIKPGTLRAILKGAGLSTEEFITLLK